MTTPARRRRRLLVPAAALLAGGVLLTASCASSPPADIGLVDGRLRSCPDTPNCVASENTDAGHRVPPFRYEGPAEPAWQRLSATVRASGGRIERETGGYLWATFRSLIFRFVDDVEFRHDPAARVIHVRSAARLGHSDFGVNRRRVERLRRAWRAAAEQ